MDEATVIIFRKFIDHLRYRGWVVHEDNIMEDDLINEFALKHQDVKLVHEGQKHSTSDKALPVTPEKEKE